MRGDQLARQWRVIRAIEANFNGLTDSKIAKRKETGIRRINRAMESPQEAESFLCTEGVDLSNRWAFVEAYEFKILSPSILTALVFLFSYGGITRLLAGV